MTPRDPLPEPWRTALERKGITSKRGLATAAGISPQTAKRLIDGIGAPSSDTVNLVADRLFAGDRNYVWVTLVGADREDHGDFDLPPEASQLDPEQREAVLAVVRAMLPRTGRGVRRAQLEQDPPGNVRDLVPPIKKTVQTQAARKGRPALHRDGGEGS